MPIETGHINEGQIIEEVPPIYLPEEKAFEEIESNISLFTRLFKPPSSFPTKHTSYLVNILCVLAGNYIFLIKFLMIFIKISSCVFKS